MFYLLNTYVKLSLKIHNCVCFHNRNSFLKNIFNCWKSRITFSQYKAIPKEAICSAIIDQESKKLTQNNITQDISDSHDTTEQNIDELPDKDEKRTQAQMKRQLQILYRYRFFITVLTLKLVAIT